MVMNDNAGLGGLLGELRGVGVDCGVGRGVALVRRLRGVVGGMTGDVVALVLVDRLAAGVAGLLGDAGSDYWGAEVAGVVGALVEYFGRGGGRYWRVRAAVVSVKGGVGLACNMAELEGAYRRVSVGSVVARDLGEGRAWLAGLLVEGWFAGLSNDVEGFWRGLRLLNVPDREIGVLQERYTTGGVFYGEGLVLW